MNANEMTTLAKMAVICSLVVLVIGAGMSVWYIMWDHTNSIQREWESAARSASAEKLYSLQEQSASADTLPNDKEVLEAHPLVTTVANTLSEFNEDSLIYIYVVERPPTTSFRNPRLYTYENVNITSHGTGTPIEGWGSRRTYQSINPVTDSVKELLTYSQYRCHLHIQEVNQDGNTFIGIAVEILSE